MPSETTLNPLNYRPHSPWAVAAVVLAGMTVAGFLIPALTGLALLSVVSALVALHGIARYEMSGRWLALSAAGMSVILVAVIPTWHVVRFRAEAPAGVVRLNFKELTSSDDWGAGLEQYVGQRVCLKGYVYPTDQFQGITSFLLSSDGNARPKQGSVGVILASPGTWDWSNNGQAVTGTLFRNLTFVEGETEPKWMLRDSEIRPARSPLQLAFSKRSTGC